MLRGTSIKRSSKSNHQLPRLKAEPSSCKGTLAREPSPSLSLVRGRQMCLCANTAMRTRLQSSALSHSPTHTLPHHRPRPVVPETQTSMQAAATTGQTQRNVFFIIAQPNAVPNIWLISSHVVPSGLALESFLMLPRLISSSLLPLEIDRQRRLPPIQDRGPRHKLKRQGSRPGPESESATKSVACPEGSPRIRAPIPKCSR